jgi:hypothetical protein
MIAACGLAFAWRQANAKASGKKKFTRKTDLQSVPAGRDGLQIRPTGKRSPAVRLNRER